MVDDGSTDETAVLIGELSQKAKFPVSLLQQRNSGQCIAINRGVSCAKGVFIGILDSDDWYEPNALERCWHHWRCIPEKARLGFVGVTALTSLPDGSLVGSKFPQDVFDSDSIDISTRYSVTGDKKGFQLRSILLNYPFPEDIGKTVPQGIVWNRIALKFRTRFVNEMWALVEYQADGMSKRVDEIRMGSPKAFIAFYQEFLALPRPLPIRSTVRRSANLVRLAVHVRASNAFRGVPKGRLIFGFLPGVALYACDIFRARCGQLLRDCQ